MIGVHQSVAREDDSPTDDRIVCLNATWADYQRLLELRGDCSSPRIAYLEGTVEIMTPSRTHGVLKSLLGRLVEVYCLHNQIDFVTLGSWTLEDKTVQRGVEPDECYIFGSEETDRPHLAIEVIWTSGGLDKLQIYRKLRVREVWIWRKGRLVPHILVDEHYVSATRSEVLPGIDLAQLVSFLDRPTTSQAIREYRTALESKE
ncbi:MAG: Uma2 family endonuclease [Deltaproteobacteria bacterium]|nr:Uma2 family endonuclease [Deltaproteobacteria bacterium]